MNIRRIAADNIRFIREKRGLKQAELADDADVSRSYMGYIERGEKSVTIDLLDKIAKVLKVSPGVLLTPNAYRSVE